MSKKSFIKHSSNEDLTAISSEKKRSVRQRVFIIFKRTHITGKQDEVIAVKLSKASADKLIDQMAGTYMIKWYANKD